MNRLAPFFTLSALFAAAALPAQAQREPSAADIERIRAELRAKNGERETQESQRGRLECEAIAALPELPPEQTKALTRNAWLQLDNQMDTLRAVVQCEPIATSATSRRAPLLLKETSWLALAPGRWRIHVTAGTGDGRLDVQVPPLELQAQRGHAYRLAFTREIERELRRQQRALNKPAPIATPAPTPPARRPAP